MNLSNRLSPKISVLLSGLVGGVLLFGCAAGSHLSSSPMSERGAPTAESASGSASDAKVAAEVPKVRPQLIKNASLEMTVASVENAQKTVSTIVQTQQGDVLELQDQTPQTERDHHTLSMQLRIPQERLDAALDALAALGTVQERSITAEDVSTQLIDLSARLRNLRKTEQTLLGIMERSGSVGDVLKVAQEVSRTREQIEQIAAQVSHLNNQVAYSTITLQLVEATATNRSGQPLGLQFGETWKRATTSVSSLTVSLLKLGLWLIAYTPYLLILVGIGVLLYRRKHRQMAISTQPTLSDAGNSSSEK
ncbi:MAG: DUF4349 domain-containing protein [Scytolyngbya sp. HA4215-MV1]|nr:DUF4349 domain-containing protein [Scytolyngbya sp. HA4215-MV1]